MNHLNSHRFGSGAAPTFLYDNLLAMYSLRRPDMTTAWTKAALRASIEGTAKRKYIFFDTNGVISLSSLVGDDYTTPSTETLATWAGTDTVLVKDWIGITSNNVVDSDLILESAEASEARNPILMASGSISLSNGKPTLSFQRTTIQEMTAKVQGLVGMDDLSAFSVMYVTENKLSTNTGKFFTNASSGGFYLHHDTSVGKIISTIPPSSIVYTSSQLTVDQQRIQLMTYTPVIAPTAASVKGYYNNLLQNTLTAYTSFTNEGLKVGGESLVPSEIFVGNISEIIIMNEDVSGSYTSHFNEVNSYYETY